MPRLTIFFGALLTLLGIITFCATGAHAPTALIPTVIGLILVLSGALARSEDPKTRMVWMHTAVTIGLIGFIGATVRMTSAMVKTHGGPFPHPAAVYEQAAMALLCLIFVVLCVRSFYRSATYPITPSKHQRLQKDSLVFAGGRNLSLLL